MDNIELFRKEIYRGINRRLRESFIKKNYPEFYNYIISNYKFDSFIESLYNFVNPNRKKCKECKGDTSFKSFTKGYLDFCSVKCSSNNKEVRNKYKNSVLEKYGVDNVSKSDEIKNIKKDRSIERYGVDNIFKSKIIRERIEKTMVERYGVKNAFQSDEIKMKIRKTMMWKYGVDHNSKCKDVVKKRQKTNIDRYGETSFSKTAEFSKIMSEWNKDNIFEKSKTYLKSDYKLLEIDNGEYIIEHISCGEKFKMQPQLVRLRSNSKQDICKKCNPFVKRYSNSEKEVMDFIHKFNNVIPNYRIDNRELDIFLPDLNIGIEYNGLYWHSELFKNKNYHLEKTDFFNLNGIRLIHIWEDEWKFKREIVQSILMNVVGESKRIYARKCIIGEVDNKSVREFLTKNHIQGFVGSKVKLGLYYEDELVSLMTFGNLRKNLGQVAKGGSYELLRFCNVLNTTVVGGASKLFKYFIENHNPTYILSYADRSRYNGELYSKLGFEFKYNTKPSWFYNIDGIRINRYSFRKDILVKNGYDPTKSSKQIMLDRGYYRVYDCGVSKWEMSLLKENNSIF